MQLCEMFSIPSTRELLQRMTATEIMKWIAYKETQAEDMAVSDPKMKASDPAQLFQMFKVNTIKAGGKVN